MPGRGAQHWSKGLALHKSPVDGGEGAAQQENSVWRAQGPGCHPSKCKNKKRRKHGKGLAADCWMSRCVDHETSQTSASASPLGSHPAVLHGLQSPGVMTPEPGSWPTLSPHIPAPKGSQHSTELHRTQTKVALPLLPLGTIGGQGQSPGSALCHLWLVALACLTRQAPEDRFSTCPPSLGLCLPFPFILGALSLLG